MDSKKSVDDLNQDKTRERLVEEMAKTAQPIDFEQLVSDGILEKVSGGYRIKDESRLPEHVKSRIRGVGAKGKLLFHGKL